MDELALIVAGGLVGFVSAQGTALIQRHRDRKDEERRDLDETRRLLMMLDDILRHTHPREFGITPDLAATLAHALTRHSGIMTNDEASNFVTSLRQGFREGKTHDPLERITGLIATIDNQLDD